MEKRNQSFKCTLILLIIFILSINVSHASEAVTSEIENLERQLKEKKKERAAKVLEARALVKNYEQEKELPSHSRLNHPSKVSLSHQRFMSPKDSEGTGTPVKALSILSSHLYPFGSSKSALGVGIDLSFISKEEVAGAGASAQESDHMGPLGVSLRKLLFTKNRFDVEAFAQVSLYTLSDEELKGTLLGRDIYRAGIGLGKRGDSFFVQNNFSITAPSGIKQAVGNIEYEYEFGTIYASKILFGMHFLEHFEVGGFGEIMLSDNFEVDGGDFSLETGRNRVLAAGPEFSYKSGQFGLTLYGRYLVDSTKDADFDLLGDLMGSGAGQGHFGLRFNLFL